MYSYYQRVFVVRTSIYTLQLYSVVYTKLLSAFHDLLCINIEKLSNSFKLSTQFSGKTLIASITIKIILHVNLH